MVVSTFQKRGLLRDFRRQAAAKSPAQSLYDALQSILSAPVVTVQKGRILLSVTAGETTASYTTSIGLNQAQLMEVISELIDRYEDAQGELITGGNANPSDDQVFTQMMDNLRAIKGFTNNWMYLAK